jgi:Flp pilus assembly protein TadD
MQMSRGQTAQAIGIVKSAAERNPKDAAALNLLGQLYLAQHNMPLAIDTLNSAVAASPGWWVPYRNLAVAKYAAKDTAGATAAYEAGIKAAPAEPQLPTELAMLHVGRGHVDDAIAVYESWHQGNPRVQSVTNNLAMLLVSYKKDRASLDRARDLTAAFASSNDSALLDTNGWVHFKRAEYADALPVLQKALQRAPNSKEIYYHLGMAELQAGQTDRARKDLETALSGSEQFSGSDEARTALAALKSRSG